MSQPRKYSRGHIHNILLLCIGTRNDAVWNVIKGPERACISTAEVAARSAGVMQLVRYLYRSLDTFPTPAYDIIYNIIYNIARAASVGRCDNRDDFSR